MPRLHFSGNHYRSNGYFFQHSGDYEVDERKAAQVLLDFPHMFSTCDERSPANDTVSSKPKHIPPVPRPLSKMNRAELEGTATDNGLENTHEHNNNRISSMPSEKENFTSSDSLSPKRVKT